ncbi:MAG: superoxide dismutase [Crocinitomicaceae bacterium]|nr:superoxide dismutase [Crocinitomicaceae bacterium]
MKLILFSIIVSISGVILAQEFTLPALQFSYDAYEQGIDAKTMEIHHSKHHKGYVRKLNKAVAESKLEGKSLEDLLMYASYRSLGVRNNSGGHYNHTLFWEILTPTSDNSAPGSASKAFENSIIKHFGSMDALRKQLSVAAAKRFGSGWAWLVVTPNKELVVSSTPNQDNPIMDVSDVRGIPILGIDVWEHAYYLRYQNKRGDYLSAIWSLLDWGVVSEKYAAALNAPILAKIEKENWPEMNAFHKVLAQTFHAAEKGDFKPLRNLSGALYAKAILLQDSDVPKPLLKPEVSLALVRLEKKCASLNKLVGKNAREKSLMKMMNGVHDIFHEVQGLCHD